MLDSFPEGAACCCYFRLGELSANYRVPVETSPD